jgi:hypothetical protein
MPGPAPKTTIEQRRRVLALVGVGRSYSAVAAEVFGHERFRGRVERIVRRDPSGPRSLPSLDELLAQRPPVEPDEDDAELEPESWLEKLLPLTGQC